MKLVLYRNARRAVDEIYQLIIDGLFKNDKETIIGILDNYTSDNVFGCRCEWVDDEHVNIDVRPSRALEYIAINLTITEENIGKK